MSDKDSVIIPKFDGDYEHWAMLMENLLRSKEWWDLIEPVIVQPEPHVILTGAQRTERAEMSVKDYKVKNYLFASIDKTILKTILKKNTSKELWDSMKKKYQGNHRVQSAQLQRLRRSFEVLEMQVGENITEYFSRVMEVTNDMRNLGEDMPDSKVVEKILRTLVEKFTYVVCAIEESNNIKDLTVDGLQSSLMVHEQNLSRHESEEKVLKVEGQWGSYSGRGRGNYSTRGRGRTGGRSGFQGRSGATFSNKEHIECFKCHQMGHYKSECPTWNKEANFTEMEEEMLLMAHAKELKPIKEQVWFLDSGCSNHMCGNEEWFIDLDPSFKQNVKLGDDRRLLVEGRGNLRLEIAGIIQIITDVYFVPGLKNNLLSVGQLQQKGLRFIIDNGTCEVWHKLHKRMIMRSNMTKNRMFVILASIKRKKEGKEETCLQVVEKTDDLWHKRFGHLSYGGLKSLAEKKMVLGIQGFNSEEKEVICEICMRGKQNREIIPKKSLWMSSRCLQLVHTDICGPISPISESGKRYVINFIDDYSRKCWTYFLSEKSEAFRIFKEFKAAAERESGQTIVCLRSDRGGEYNSHEFGDYCREKGIKRQLTAAYTPQQNGVAERKNRSILNMTRCMLIERAVPRRFWPEAVQYAVHILNRSPSKALGNVTPEEKWSKLKPSVEHLRIFGCIAYAMVPYEKRTKLEEKSLKCVMLGVSKESKAYRLFNPETKKLLISRDVRFDEAKGWNWENQTQEDKLVLQESEGELGKRIVQNGPDEETADEESANDEIEESVEETAGNDQHDSDNSPQPPARETYERQRKKPGWMKDYVTDKAGFLIAEEGEDILNMFTASEDPESFEDAVQQEVWRKAMEAEINSIEENNTWELVDLPAGAKVIGVKWIFKISSPSSAIRNPALSVTCVRRSYDC